MSMQSVAAYSLIHATVRALYSTMLTPEEWSRLIQAQDFNAVLGILSKTAYAPYLNLKDVEMTPRRAVYQVRRHLTDMYEKVIRLAPEPGRELLLWLWRLYEVDNLKATLRGIDAHASWEQVLFLLYPTPRHATVTLDDMEKMVRSGSVGQALTFIEHTPYYDTLAHAVERYKAEGNIFPLEVALDLTHARRLWQSIEELSGPDHKQAMHIVGSRLDLDNLMWAIRYRVYHHLSEEEIINYTLPLGYQVRDEDIRAIAAGAEIAQVVEHIYPDIDSVEQITERNGAGLEELELALHLRIVNLCHRTFIGYPFHIGIPIAYLVLNEYESRDLTVLIEAKASRLPIETFVSLLVVQPPTHQAGWR